jgi:hypothetical protein
LNIGVLLHFPWEEHWAWRWDGEGEDQWRDRLKRGYLDWYRYIDSVKLSRKPAIKEQISFYVNLMREGKSLVPVQEYIRPSKDMLRKQQWPVEQSEMQSVQAQKDWMDRTQEEIPALMRTWREEMIQS